MKFSQALIPTLKETPAEAEAISHKLMYRAGLIRKLVAGVYTYLPLGLKVLKKIEQIIRDEMNAQGAQEVLMPAIQPPDLWHKTGRYDAMGDEMIKYKDRFGREMVLGPTHEEVITDIVKGEIRSYRDLPKILYQIQTKFRDEPRPRFGIVRSKEFIMKDAYSFDADQQSLDANYKKMHKAYCNIFKKCGLDYMVVNADCGVMGGSESAEFLVKTDAGEDLVLVGKCGCAQAVSEEKAKAVTEKCPQCGKQSSFEVVRALELGHIFKLGTKYTEALGANFLDKNGKQQPIIMGCYGIGVNRIIAAAIESHNDEKGIIWPKSISPYQLIIIPLKVKDKKLVSASEKLYEELKKQGIDCLLDDRDVSAGIKFKDAELIGIPTQVILGPKGLEKNKLEISSRENNTKKEVKTSEAVKYIVKTLK